MAGKCNTSLPIHVATEKKQPSYLHLSFDKYPTITPIDWNHFKESFPPYTDQPPTL